MKIGLRAIPYLQWGFLATLAVFLVAGAIFYRGLLLLENSEVWVVHTHEVLENLQGLESEIEAIESAYRGFALMGEEVSLDRYHESVLHVRQREHILGELVADNPSQENKLRTLKEIIERKIRFGDSVIDLRRTSGPDAASESLRLGQGEGIMSELRAVIANMADEEHRLLHKRDAEVEHRSYLTKRLLILQAVLCLVVGVVVLTVHRLLAKIELSASRQIEEQFRTLVERVQDYAIFMLDPQGKVLTWNSGAERLKGYKADEIIGQDFARFYPSDTSDSPNPHDGLRIAVERGRFQTEGWRIRKDGSRFWAHVTITPSFDSAGNLRGFIKITRNITEAWDSEGRYQSLLESAPDAMVIVNIRGEIELANAQIAKLFGYTKQEVLGKSMEIFVPTKFRGTHGELFQSYFRTPRSLKTGAGLELHGLCKDGTEFPLEIMLSPMESRGGMVVIVATAISVSEKRWNGFWPRRSPI